MQTAVVRIARQRGVAESVVRKEAKGIAATMGHNLGTNAIRLMGYMLHKVLSAVYQEVSPPIHMHPSAAARGHAPLIRSRSCTTLLSINLTPTNAGPDLAELYNSQLYRSGSTRPSSTLSKRR